MQILAWGLIGVVWYYSDRQYRGGEDHPGRGAAQPGSIRAGVH
ncbi:MAG: hypothetical protein ACXACI_05335 [Candidatus Hodarchaeales archaeon]|jgi:hypothetical protein